MKHRPMCHKAFRRKIDTTSFKGTWDPGFPIRGQLVGYMLGQSSGGDVGMQAKFLGNGRGSPKSFLLGETLGPDPFQRVLGQFKRCVSEMLRF